MVKSTVGRMEMYILPLPMEGSAESHAKGVDVSAQRGGRGGGWGGGGGVAKSWKEESSFTHCQAPCFG